MATTFGAASRSFTARSDRAKTKVRSYSKNVTSSMRSPVLGKNIALARVDVAHSEIGTEVEIGKLDGHQKRLPAKIVAFPHYDPQKTKPRS